MVGGRSVDGKYHLYDCLVKQQLFNKVPEDCKCDGDNYKGLSREGNESWWGKT